MYVERVIYPQFLTYIFILDDVFSVYDVLLEAENVVDLNVDYGLVGVVITLLLRHSDLK